jgi:anti-sigma regulatory factor (Ser/Thr protein kinase)
VLLGVRGKGIPGLPTYKEQTTVLPPGAVLVFYTDGLTDRRTRADGSGHYTEDESVDMLRQAVRAAAASGDADAVATAAEYAVPGDIDDDMAILVVKSSPSDLASVERVFPAEPIMVSEARRLAAQTFGSWGMDAEQIDLACLLVSEVVTNSVLHASVTPSPGRRLDLDVVVPAPASAARSAEPRPVPPRAGGKAAVRVASAPADAPAAPAPGAVQVSDGAVQVSEGAVQLTMEPGRNWDTGPAGPGPSASRGARAAAREFALRLRRGASSVWVEVFDPDLRLPRIRTATDTDEGGRGLYLVEQLATRWGSRPTPEGKAVWFEMPRSGRKG